MANNFEPNAGQLEAVRHIEGPLICLAGPGTGKTQIIAMRIANLLKETQMNPYNILCLTFTESGAVAMRRRLLEIIGTAAYKVKIFTFHGFCNEVISEFPHKFPFKKDARALDEIEAIKIYKDIIDELPFNSPLRHFTAKYFYGKDIASAVKKLKKEDISIEKYRQILENEKSFHDKNHERIKSFTAQNSRTLKEPDFQQLLLEIPDLNKFFESYDLSEQKERTKIKSAIKDHMEDMENNLPKQFELAAIYEAYEKKLKESGRYDFEDMILKVLNAFKSDRELLAIYQERFQYILVDEYQDTNNSQNEVVEQIASFFESPNVFVVGDDKQSIYRFQGASLENILYFKKRYESDVKIVKLKENYRSGQYILDAAASLISKNQSTIEHFIPDINLSLHSQKGAGEKVKLYEFEDPRVENFFIAKKIQELISSGVEPKEIAVLYRKNRDSRDLIDIFERMGIPFRVNDGEDILRDPEIIKFLNILRVVDNPGRSELLLNVLFYDFFDFQNLDVAKLSRYAYSRKKDIFSIIASKTELESADLAEPEKFYAFAQKLASWQGFNANKIFTQTFDLILKESNFLKYLLSKDDKVENLNRLNTLFEKIKTLNANDHALNIHKFIKYIELFLENDVKIGEHVLSTKKNAVQLMTAHKSKGLEFEQVFIMKCNDGHWGHLKNQDKLKLPKGILKTQILNEDEKDEEERRLFYVAMTRAKTEVHISHTKQNGDGKELLPSMFIADINPDFVAKVSTVELEEQAAERLQTVFLEPVPKEPDKELEDYLKSLLEDYQLNITHLNNYLTCPWQFYYKNLLRAPSAKSKDQALGTAVHSALDSFVRNPNKDKLLENFENDLKDEILTKEEHEETLARGREILSEYFERYAQTFNFNCLTEYNFARKNVFFEGVPITGKIDKIEIIDPQKKLVNLVDYKTGNPDGKSDKLARNGDYWRQIIFYKLLCDNSDNFEYTMVSGQIDFVQKSKQKCEFIKKNLEITKEDIEMLSTQIKDSYQEILSLEFLHFLPERYCGKCEYCTDFA